MVTFTSCHGIGLVSPPVLPVEPGGFPPVEFCGWVLVDVGLEPVSLDAARRIANYPKQRHHGDDQRDHRQHPGRGKSAPPGSDSLGLQTPGEPVIQPLVAPRRTYGRGWDLRVIISCFDSCHNLEAVG